MKEVRFENYVSPLSCASAMLNRTPSAMSLEQVKEQYNLSFDPIVTLNGYGFYIVLSPRTDLEDDNAPLFGEGWGNWEAQYSYWLDWVRGVEPFDEGAEDNYAEGI